MSATAQIPPTVSQLVGCSGPVLDEFGQPLVGREAVKASGVPPVAPGGLVQILVTTNGVIYPPLESGDPDPRHTVLATSHIGAGVSPLLTRSGKFSLALAPRPAGGTRIFVRVYNASTTKEASYYGDSQVFTVSSLSNTVFLASIPATDKARRPVDTDGDGLSDSQEQSLGLDERALDSDGDGLNDAEEVVAGSDALDQDSYPRITSITVLGNGSVRLTWWPPAAARTYKAYEKTDLSEEGPPATPVSTYVSSGTGDFLLITNGNDSGVATYMLKVSK